MKRPLRWRDDINLWSLLELNQVFAEEYISIGRVFQYWMGIEDPSGESLSNEHYADYHQTLNDLLSQCNKVGLATAEKLVSNTLAVLDPNISYRDACLKMGELCRCVEAEIESKMFFYIPAERSKYLALFRFGGAFDLGDELKKFEPVFEKFPGMWFEVCEAGNCFATGAFTASVYHLMRVCEYGLVSLASELGLEPGFSSWNTILSGIDTKVKKNSSTKPPDWKRDEEFFSESAALMRNVKNSWRNAASHIPRRYDQQRARVIFNSVEALTLHLGTRLGEVSIPATGTILADPDAAVPTEEDRRRTEASVKLEKNEGIR